MQVLCMRDEILRIYIFTIFRVLLSRNFVIMSANSMYGYDYDYSSDVLSCCETCTNVVQSGMCLIQDAFI